MTLRTAAAGTPTELGVPGSGLAVQGSAASGAAKSGNPVQIGSVFHTTPQVVADGQVVEAQATDRGAVIQQPNFVKTSGSFTANSQSSATPTVPAQSYYFVISGTWTGTIQPQGSYDGITWFNTFVSAANLSGFFVTISSSNSYVVNNGVPYFRLTTTAWTSGTANYNMMSSQVVDTVYVRQQTQYLLSAFTKPGIPNANATYSAAATFAAAASATDIFTITGSATKTIYIRRIRVQATQTIGAVRDILLIKRSAANTGGTSTTPTLVPHDSVYSAATAVVRAYTANPSGLGAAVGDVRRDKIWIPSTAVAPEENTWEFAPSFTQPLVLRGTSQMLCVNLNGVSSGGNSFAISVELVEE